MLTLVITYHQPTLIRGVHELGRVSFELIKLAHLVVGPNVQVQTHLQVIYIYIYIHSFVSNALALSRPVPKLQISIRFGVQFLNRT